jgi:protocatechuate 3,4-dioxygenase beta subunit
MSEPVPAGRGDERRLTRRGALAGFGGLVLGVAVAGCGGDDEPAASASAPATTAASTGATTATTDADAACVLSPEQTEGPYYVDIDRVRSDITEGTAGTPLALRVAVVDVGDGCAALRDAAVEVWHCDAGGVYSGFAEEQTEGQTFLRGTQMTDATGVATFATIYPGWYRGRTVHIHVKVFAGASEAYTGQLYFDDALTDEVFARAPYDSRGERDTRNDDDGIYPGEAALVATTAAGDGYEGSITLGIRAA